MIEALGDELDRPWERPDGTSRTYLLKGKLYDAVAETGPGRVKVARESTRGASPRVRAAGFWVWGQAAGDKAAGVDRDELLVAVRRGLKDDSPLVREQAVQVFRMFKYDPPEVVDQVVPLLIAALDDRAKPREGMYCPAASAALVLGAFKGKAKPAVAALIKATAAEDFFVAASSCRALNEIAQSDQSIADDVVKTLRSVFVDKKRPEGVRENSIRSLIGLSPASRHVIPDLIELLDDPKAPSDLRYASIAAITDMRLRAVPAVPALIKRLEQTSDEKELMLLFLAFETIGPVAVEADGPIVKWLERNRTRQETAEASAAIGGGPILKWVEGAVYPLVEVRATAALAAIRK